MLLHRLRRWPNNNPTLAEHHMLAGLCQKLAQRCKTLGQRYFNVFSNLSQQTRYIESMLIYCWSKVYDPVPTLKQHAEYLNMLVD